MKNRFQMLLILFCCIVFFSACSNIQTISQPCYAAFGESKTSNQVVFYKIFEETCLFESAKRYIAGDEAPSGNSALFMVLDRALVGETFVSVLGFVAEHEGKNYLRINIMTATKTEEGNFVEGAYDGWRIIYFGNKKLETRTYLTHILLDDAFVAFRGADFVLFASIDSRAAHPGIEPKALNDLIEPYLEFMRRTLNLECENDPKHQT